MLILAAALALPMGLVLGLLGGGGSILTLPILVYALGLGAKQAIATSLVVVGITSAIGTVQHARAGNVEYRVGLIFGVFAMLGAYGGGLLAGFISGQILILMFVALMIVASIYMLRPRPQLQPTSRDIAPLKIMLEGLVVGGITGMVGAGGGFVVVPALVLFGGLGMRAAIGTSLFIITLKAFAALAGHLGHVSIDLTLVAAITVPAIIGSIIGTMLSRRLNPQNLKQMFAYFVLLMAGFMLYKESPAWLIESVFVTYWPAWTAALVAAIATIVIRARRVRQRDAKPGTETDASSAHLQHALDRA